MHLNETRKQAATQSRYGTNWGKTRVHSQASRWEEVRCLFPLSWDACDNLNKLRPHKPFEL